MELNLGIQQKQTVSQHTIMTARILQMSQLELKEYLEEAALENPVLEIEEPKELDSDKDIYRVKWLEATDYQNREYHRDDYADSGFEQGGSHIGFPSGRMEDYLRMQLLQREYPERMQAILEFLSCSLERTGYFRDDIAQIAGYLKVREEEVREALTILQSLEPAGIAATNVTECLLLQAERRKDAPPYVREVLENYLEALGANRINRIAAALGISTGEVQAIREWIKTLNPVPGNLFDQGERVPYIRIDAYVEKRNGALVLTMNERGIPQVSISSYYLEMKQTTEDAEAKEYLQKKIAQAQELMTTIALRGSTSERIIRLIVELQHSFFEKGPGNKQPMTLADLAEQTGLHVSTISRALRERYLQCKWGIFPLRYFLTIQTGSDMQGEIQTQDRVLEAIRSIIERENKHKPLSDEEIRRELQQRGLTVSRRTVSKYRTSMGIPVKSARRQWS